MEVQLENRNILNTLLSAVLLLVVFTTQSFASVGGADQKIPRYNPNNVIMFGGSTAKVFGTDEGTNGIYLTDPYTNNQRKVWAGTFKGNLDGKM